MTSKAALASGSVSALRAEVTANSEAQTHTHKHTLSQSNSQLVHKRNTSSGSVAMTTSQAGSSSGAVSVSASSSTDSHGQSRSVIIPHTQSQSRSQQHDPIQFSDGQASPNAIQRPTPLSAPSHQQPKLSPKIPPLHYYPNQPFTAGQHANSGHAQQISSGTSLHANALPNTPSPASSMMSFSNSTDSARSSHSSSPMAPHSHSSSPALQVSAAGQLTGGVLISPNTSPQHSETNTPQPAFLAQRVTDYATPGASGATVAEAKESGKLPNVGFRLHGLSGVHVNPISSAVNNPLVQRSSAMAAVPTSSNSTTSGATSGSFHNSTESDDSPTYQPATPDSDETSGDGDGDGDHDHERGVDDDDDDDSKETEDRTLLFVGDLPKHATEADLRKIFGVYGEVLSVVRRHLPSVDHEQNASPDRVVQSDVVHLPGAMSTPHYAFIRYSTSDCALVARDKLHGFLIGQQKIRVGFAQRNTTLFIGDLDGSVSTSRLINLFREFGPLVEEECFVKEGSGKYGFVRFVRREHAEVAKRQMNKKVVGRRPIRIGWGDNGTQRHCVFLQFDPLAFQTNNNLSPKHAKAFSPNGTARSLHDVSALSATNASSSVLSSAAVDALITAFQMRDECLQSLFSHYGRLSHVSLPYEKNGLLKGYAFCHYEENEDGERSARAAISDLLQREKIRRHNEFVSLQTLRAERRPRRNTTAGVTPNANNDNASGQQAANQSNTQNNEADNAINSLQSAEESPTSTSAASVSASSSASLSSTVTSAAAYSTVSPVNSSIPLVSDQDLRSDRGASMGQVLLGCAFVNIGFGRRQVFNKRNKRMAEKERARELKEKKRIKSKQSSRVPANAMLQHMQHAHAPQNAIGTTAASNAMHAVSHSHSHLPPLTHPALPIIRAQAHNAGGSLRANSDGVVGNIRQRNENNNAQTGIGSGGGADGIGTAISSAQARGPHPLSVSTTSSNSSSAHSQSMQFAHHAQPLSPVNLSNVNVSSLPYFAHSHSALASHAVSPTLPHHSLAASIGVQAAAAHSNVAAAAASWMLPVQHGNAYNVNVPMSIGVPMSMQSMPFIPAQIDPATAATMGLFLNSATPNSSNANSSAAAAAAAAYYAGDVQAAQAAQAQAQAALYQDALQALAASQLQQQRRVLASESLGRGDFQSVGVHHVPSPQLSVASLSSALPSPTSAQARNSLGSSSLDAQTEMLMRQMNMNILQQQQLIQMATAASAGNSADTLAAAAGLSPAVAQQLRRLDTTTTGESDSPNVLTLSGQPLSPTVRHTTMSSTHPSTAAALLHQSFASMPHAHAHAAHAAMHAMSGASSSPVLPLMHLQSFVPANAAAGHAMSPTHHSVSASGPASAANLNLATMQHHHQHQLVQLASTLNQIPAATALYHQNSQ